MSAAVREATGLGLPASSDLGRAREAALKALRDFGSYETTAVGYTSGSRVLVIGPEPSAVAAARRLKSAFLECTVLASPGGPEAEPIESLPVLRAALATLEGHLGAFQATAVNADGAVDITPMAGREGGFDLVLDLGIPPALGSEIPPFGYYAPGADAQALENALTAIPDMVGEFEKPKFFAYDPAICAHGERGLSGCTRCLEVCPTAAIRSIGERIQVDPHLCQGAGSCATVCPTGALIYACPPPSVFIDALRKALRAFRQMLPDCRPGLLFHDRDAGREWLAGPGVEIPGVVVPVELEEIGSAGLESWLSALTFGAGWVALLVPANTPPSVRRALTREVELGQAVLSGMGYPAEVLSLVEEQDAARRLVMLGASGRALSLPDAGFQGFDEKRTSLGLALGHLYEHAPQRPDAVTLAPGAPFGEVLVDRDTCTLCMACAAVCPSAAITSGTESPQLVFQEANCVQCGMCAAACPEDAVRLLPRMVLAPELRSQPRILNEEQPFCCVRCGKPFATRSMMRRITEKLKGHWMYQDEVALRRLQMCEDCRVREMFAGGGQP